ncbi:hypothetical protein ACHWQZ_G010556 [Mnemiopsis leidyi]
MPPKETSSEESSSSSKEKVKLFGVNDLASDYFQVLHQKGRPKLCRILWFILIIVLTAFTVYLTYRLIYNYLQFGSFNKSETEWKSGLNLPAISICGTNYLNYTALKAALAAENSVAEHEGGDSLQKEFDDLVTDFRRYESYGENLTAEDALKAKDLLNWERSKGSITVRFKTDIYDMVVGHFDYIFRGVGYRVEEEQKVEMINPTELGMCLEINDKEELIQDVLGRNGMFTIDVDAHVKDYLFTTQTLGFVVFIRDYDETVMLNQGGYLIAPGTETFMKLSAQNVTRLGYPWGTCENVLSKYSKYGKRFESVRECQERQQIEAMFKHCQCIPWYFAERMYTEKRYSVLDEAVDAIKTSKYSRKRSTDTEDIDQEIKTTETRNGGASESQVFHSNYTEHICTFIQENLCKGLISNEIKNGVLTMEECPEPCKYNTWSVELDSTAFPPTKEYFEHFIKYDAAIKDEKADFDYARENMARIHIFYKELKVDKQSQTPAYDISSFIAELGGTIDLFIGFSIFTVAQLIEIGIAFLVHKVLQRSKSSKRKNESG